MNATAALPRLLLLEDDPVSAAFLVAALEALPARVDVAGSLSEAEPLRDDAHALWLFDANLPDGTGAALLARWRACGLATPALAHTAEPRKDERQALIAAGFADVLTKPLTVTQAQDAVRGMLDMTARDMTAQGMPADDARAPSSASPIWDDAIASRAMNGNVAHIAAMRALFIAELPATRTRIADAFSRRDVDAVRSELHKLLAACGFAGASRMRTAAMRLNDVSMNDVLLDDVPTRREAFARFEAALEDTLSTDADSPRHA